jgi:hypothetical protein
MDTTVLQLKNDSIELISTVGSLHIDPFLLHKSHFSIGSTHRIMLYKRPHLLVPYGSLALVEQLLRWVQFIQPNKRIIIVIVWNHFIHEPNDSISYQKHPNLGLDELFEFQTLVGNMPLVVVLSPFSTVV